MGNKGTVAKSDSARLYRNTAEFHRSCGSGIFSKYRAFVWRRIPALAIAGGYNIPGIDPVCDQAGYYQVPGNIPVHQGSVSCPDSDCAQAAGTVGEFIGVESPDPVRFSDLISYDLEREEVIQNTLHFLDGRPANNILLYGDRGTGKSSTVKALANEYHDRGLRIIEVPKGLLADFPLIIRRLDGRNLKFILLSTTCLSKTTKKTILLKAILEGGLESNLTTYSYIPPTGST